MRGARRPYLGGGASRWAQTLGLSKCRPLHTQTITRPMRPQSRATCLTALAVFPYRLGPLCERDPDVPPSATATRSSDYAAHWAGRVRGHLARVSFRYWQLPHLCRSNPYPHPYRDAEAPSIVGPHSGPTRETYTLRTRIYMPLRGNTRDGDRHAGRHMGHSGAEPPQGSVH